MRNKTKEEILSVMHRAKNNMEEKFGQTVEIVQSYCENHSNSMKTLGESLKLMADADYVYLAEGWNEAFGCRVEENCAREYGKKVVYEV